MWWNQKNSVASKQWQEVIARYANLVMHCYHKGDVSGIQVTITGFTHLCYVFNKVDDCSAIVQQFEQALLQEALPENELPYMHWLLNHFLQIEQDKPQEFMLPWYQQLDDEFVLRQQIKTKFPHLSSTQITAAILQQAQQAIPN